MSEAHPERRGMRYRHHPVAFKRAVVEQSLQSNVSVSRLAREHGVNANQIFAWRKAYQEGRLGAPAFLPVTVTEADEAATVIEPNAPGALSGRVVLERRGTRLVIEGEPSAQVLAQVLAALLR
nr:transposase [Zoogloeaceae bacterium]